MKKIFLVLALIISFFLWKNEIVAYFSPPPSSPYYISGITPIMQIDSSLCWGACIEMLVKKNNPTSSFSQCDLYPPSCKPCNVCCMTKKCSSINSLNKVGVKQKLHLLGYNCAYSSSTTLLNFSTICGELRRTNQPIFARVVRRFRGSVPSGHWILITGCYKNSLGEHIEFIDPWTASCSGCKATILFKNTLFIIKDIIVINIIP